MIPAFPRRGLALVALAAAAVLAGCASDKAAEVEAARLAAEAAALARMPPPIAMNQSVAQSAAIYLAFTRDIATIHGGFADPAAVQEALARGSAYDPDQLSRGLVAYASILALQSPEFLAGVRQYAGDRAMRDKVIADIVADPGYASTLPGADAAAGLIISTLKINIDAMGRAANSVEQDAYDIQRRFDPRRSWALAQVSGRESRLQNTKTLSGQTMLPSAEEAARLFEAANTGGGLPVAGERRAPPYAPAVTNALALAALAALGAAGENATANTDALQYEPTSQFCLSMSKLNLYQCLAASRPSYEDMFCVGRHVMRDLATCARGAAMPAAIVEVGDLVTTGPARPSIDPAPLDPAPSITPAPIVIPAPTPPQVPPPSVTRSRPGPPPPAVTATERLNTAPASPAD